MQLILIRYDRLAGRKKTQHITSLSLINVSVAAFYWHYKEQENNRLQILAANYSQDLLALPFKIFRLFIFPHLSVFSVHIELKESRALHVCT